ncbi:MAG TPA: hypothetical protein VFK68_06585 [Propionibacteriaceae bacterium]|nr:hypothetical protein [Propionibacteriaceae bacterium]
MDRFRGGEEAPVPERALNMEVRGPQLAELQTVLEQLLEAMQANTDRMENPGWRGRARDYSYALGGVRDLLKTPTRDGLYDVLGSVRPLYRGPVPEGYEELAPLNERLLAALAPLRESLPGE